MKRTLIALGIGLGTFTLSAPASAEVQRIHEENGDSRYFFDSDNLAADGYPSLAERIKGQHRTARVLLIRPRVQFVSELRKSVEQL
ncbi:MAG: hypothetical protein JW751_06170 [Polyangiaceae bacterium]|nr:hypothetical protein [Polyangiaceae bacterium]